MKFLPNFLSLSVLAVVLLLFFTMKYDAFNTFSDKGIMYEKHAYAWLTGSIHNARKQGVFSTYTFTNIFRARGRRGMHDARDYNIDRYIDNDFDPNRIGQFETYKSAVRWTYSCYEVLDMVIYKLTGKGRNLIPLFNLIAIGLMILVLLVFFEWIRQVFGLGVAGFSMFLICFCHWLMQMGPYPGWGIWLNLLPFFVGMHLFSGAHSRFDVDSRKHIFVFAFVGFFLVTAISYEFVPPLAMSLFIPMFFYKSRLGLGPHKYLPQAASLAAGVFCGLFLTILIHLLMVLGMEGGISEVREFFQYKLAKRTSGNLESNEVATEVLRKAIDRSTWDVLKIYFSGSPVIGPFSVRGTLFVTSLLTPVIFIGGETFKECKRIRNDALIILACLGLALFGSFFMLIIFKSHAAIPMHMTFDYLTFCYPYIPLFALFVSLIIVALIKDFSIKMFKVDNSPKMVAGLVCCLLMASCMFGDSTNDNKKDIGKSVTKEKPVKSKKRKSNPKRNKVASYTDVAPLVDSQGKVVFDINHCGAGDYSTDKKQASMQGQIIKTKRSNPMIYFSIPKSKKISIVAYTDNDKSGITQLFYKTKGQKDFVKDQSIVKRVEEGKNQTIFNVANKEGIEDIAFKPLNRAGATIEIEELQVIAE